MNLLLMKGSDNNFPSISGASVYRAAVENCTEHLASGEEPRLNAFQMSSFLAIAFGVAKEKTLNDLAEARTRLGF